MENIPSSSEEKHEEESVINVEENSQYDNQETPFDLRTVMERWIVPEEKEKISAIIEEESVDQEEHILSEGWEEAEEKRVPEENILKEDRSFISQWRLMPLELRNIVLALFGGLLALFLINIFLIFVNWR